MRVGQLSARAWRNLEPLTVELYPRFNVLCGSNAQGKTNFLEAVYYVGTLRSFRTARALELVRFGAARAELSARVEREGLVRTLAVQLEAQQRRAEVDGKAVRSAAAYCGRLSAVVFAPEDLALPKGSPAARRRFLDRAVFEARPAYLREAQDYQRLLKHRNALLRRASRGGGRPPAGLLDVYDERLAAAGAVVVTERRRLLAGLQPRFAAAFEAIARMDVGADLVYATSEHLAAADGAADLARALAARLAAHRERDLRHGFTSSGPHTDDLLVRLDGRPARLHASQGQLRALVLALKTAEILHVAEITGDPPVLLLDDVSSELDPERNQYLFEFVREIGCQTIITTTDLGHLRLDEKHALFRVVAGSLIGEP